MKLSPTVFNGFLFVVFAGIALSLYIFHRHYQPDFQEGHQREFCWTQDDTVYRFQMRSPAVMEGYFTPLESDERGAQEVLLHEKDGWFFLNLRPNLLTWVLLFLIFNGFCFGALLYLPLFTFSTFRKKEFISRLWIVILLSLLSIVMVALLATGKFVPSHQLIPPLRLWHFFPEVFYPSESLIWQIQVPGYALGFACIFCLILIGNSVIEDWGEGVEKVKQRLIQINRLSYHLLVVLSVVLVFTVVTTYFMYQATQESVIGDLSFLLPERLLVLYGAVFTFFILLFYIPTYFKVQKLNEEALQQAPSEEAKAAIKEASDKFMKLNNPRVLLTIASPVITSLFPVIGGILKGI